MSSRSRRRVTVGAAVLGGLLCNALPAHAALTTPASTAYVVSASAIGNLVAVAPTPTSTYAPGGTTTVAGLALGPFATNATLTATTAGDPTTGDSSASATVDTLGVNLGVIGSLALTGINSSCAATPTGADGSGVIAGGTVTVGLLPPITLAANAAPNTTISIPLLGSLVLNEQSTDPTTGIITVNAVDLNLLPALGGANLTLGHVTCGGAAPVVATPMVAAPIAGGASVAALAGGMFFMRRRYVNGKSVFDAS
ncbi:MAG TPA: choice-of-anchor P family protein [Actinocrinis sp.]|nr:choice-of-anchor P family protein [Actinocrinis sp.]